MTTEIRIGKRIDLPAIVKLLADDALGAGREDAGMEMDPLYVKAFESISNDPSHEIIVLTVNGNMIVGCLQLSLIPNLTYTGGTRAQIEGVRIHKDFHSQGLGRELIRWAVRRSEEKGAVLVQLTTDKRRPDAIAFYESLGFKSSHQGMKYFI